MQPESHYYTLNVTHYDGAGSVEGIDAVDTRDSNWVDKVLADVDKRDESYWPLYICLLGNFRILRLGQRINMRSANVESLFSNLAIQLEYCIRREVLLDRLWPDGDLSLASQSLNSLLHKLRKSLSVEHDVSTPNQIPDGVAYSN